MKKLSVLLMFICVFSAISQESNNEKESVYQEILTDQIEQLSLTGDKKDSFTEISDRYYAQIQEIRKSDDSKMSKFKEFRTLQTKKEDELKDLLTEQEFDKFKELQKKYRVKMREAYKSRSKK
tara:strand:+ start:372 stop:740 length:369 start_codon:yes stop_codon:yes gene_type:complete